MYKSFKILTIEVQLSSRKARADFEGKLKRRRFKFLISFIKFKSFAARTFRTPNKYYFNLFKFLHVYKFFYMKSNLFQSIFVYWI